MKNLLLFISFFYSFSLSAQDTILKGDDNNALLHVKVCNMEGQTRIQDKIIFEGEKNSYSGLSNQEGEFNILLAEGDEYLIKIQSLGEEKEYSKIVIGDEDGIYEGSIEIRYEPAKSYTLEDVQFDSGKSTLRASSFPTLNDLAGLMQLKDKMRLEIAGHTDNVGDNEANLQLSQARAETVVHYLLQKGIATERLIAKGYGETEPLTTNETKEGRQQNRRTEARLLE